MEKTGYCWNCGHLTKEEFCNKKCLEQYRRKQSSGIKKGKRANYGVTGSTH